MFYKGMHSILKKLPGNLIFKIKSKINGIKLRFRQMMKPEINSGQSSSATKSGLIQL
jgi:hypothetical protein